MCMCVWAMRGGCNTTPDRISPISYATGHIMPATPKLYVCRDGVIPLPTITEDSRARVCYVLTPNLGMNVCA